MKLHLFHIESPSKMYFSVLQPGRSELDDFVCHYIKCTSCGVLVFARRSLRSNKEHIFPTLYGKVHFPTGKPANINLFTITIINLDWSCCQDTFSQMHSRQQNHPYDQPQTQTGIKVQMKLSVFIHFF